MEANKSLRRLRYDGNLLPVTYHAVKTFASALALIASVRAVQTLLSRQRKKREDVDKLKNGRLIDMAAIKLALFPATFPLFYTALRQRFGKGGGVAETLSSPLLALLPESIRIQFALYTTSTALLHSGKNSTVRRLLPPSWTLNVLGNAILLWSFLFRSNAFPKSYEKVILSHSRQYVPSGLSKSELEWLLANTTFPSWDEDTSNKRHRHHNPICSELHPKETSCLKNYAKAWASEVPRVGKWVGAFSALPILISPQRRRSFRNNPLPIITGWAKSTLRGTAFVVGSINTSWAMTCLLQRILPPGYMPRLRWLINGSVGSLWILALPTKRRIELALYVARLAALCSWKIWKIQGGPSIPLGEILLFALSWIQLSRIQRRGEKITGLVGLGLQRLSSTGA